MIQNNALKIALVTAALLALPGAQAAPMSTADHRSSQSCIKVDKAACDSQAGNAKDICIEQAKAKEKVALADLEFNRSGKESDRSKAMVAKAESNYAVAKERCDDLAGNPKDGV